MRKSLVSLVALGLFAGAPVMAQTSTDEATTNKQMQQQSTQQKGTKQQTSQQQGTQQQMGTLGAEQFERMLSEYDARSEVEGRIVRAITPEGQHVLVLVGPRDFEPGGSVKAKDSDVRERFKEGRFSDVVILGEPTIFRADLDEDHYIFALSADQMLRFGVHTSGLTGETGSTGTDMSRDATQLSETDTDTTVKMGQTDTEMQMNPQSGTSAQSGGQAGTGTQTNMSQTGTHTASQMGQTGTESKTGHAGRALSEPDADRIVSDLEEAGLENAAEFQGRLVKATGENNAPVFFVITSKDMGSSKAEIDVDENDLRQKLETSGLKQVQFIDNARIVRGNLEGDQVFVLAGDLFGQAGRQQ